MSPTLVNDNVSTYVNNNVPTLVNVHVIFSSNSHRQRPCHPLLTLTNNVPTLIDDDVPILTYDDV